MLLQVLFHSQIASEAGAFTIDDVLDRLADKLVRRHPHVFPSGSQDPFPPMPSRCWPNGKISNGPSAKRRDGLNRCSMASHRRSPRCCAPIKSRPAPPGSASTGPRPPASWVLGKSRRNSRAEDCAPPALVKRGEAPQIDAEFGDVLFSLVNLARSSK